MATPAAANSETTFQRQLRFSGKATKETVDKDDLPPSLFVREVETRRSKYGWSDAATMEHVGSMFQGEAAKWFHEGLMMEISMPVYEKVIKDWTLFLPRFREAYGVPEDLSRISFTSIEHQAKGETSLQYMARIMVSMADFDCLRFREGTRAPDDGTGSMAPLPMMPAILEDIKHDVNKVQHINAMLANAEYRMAQEQFRVVMEAMIQKVLSSGFASLALRKEATRLLREKKPLPVFAAEMRAIIRHHESTAQPRSYTVAEVGPSAEEDDSAQVAAVRQDQKKPLTNSGGYGRPDKKNMTCNYCKRKGHFIRECRTRMNNEARRAEGSTTPRPAPVASAAQPTLAAVQVQLPGNGSGPW